MLKKLALTAFCIWLTMSEYFPTDVVSASTLEKLRMCEQIIKKAVPLDAVPERRTKRCSPRFRPGGRFCELSFRYLSPGIEGEKCRPPRPYETDPFHPLIEVFWLFPPCGTQERAHL